MISADQSSVGPVNRTQKRTQRTRKRLLQSALLLFAERGVDATTIEDITERADLGKGTFYKHFRSKSDVVVVLMREAVNTLTVMMREQWGQPRQLSESLDSLFKVHRAFSMAQRDAFLLFFHGRLFLQLQKSDAQGLEQPFVEYLADVDRRLKPFLAVTPDGVRRLVCALIGSVSGWLAMAMLGQNGGGADRNDMAAQQAFLSRATAFLGDRDREQHAAPVPVAEPTVAGLERR